MWNMDRAYGRTVSCSAVLFSSRCAGAPAAGPSTGAPGSPQTTDGAKMPHKSRILAVVRDKPLECSPGGLIAAVRGTDRCTDNRPLCSHKEVYGARKRYIHVMCSMLLWHLHLLLCLPVEARFRCKDEGFETEHWQLEAVRRLIDTQ